MAKLITVRVSEKESYKMSPEEAAKFWQERERQAQARQASAMAVLMARRVEASDWGVILRTEDQAIAALLVSSGLDVQVESHTTLGRERVLYLDPSAPLKLDLIPAGFRFLDRFEVCAPVWSYDELAEHLGTEEERERTREVIHDLRIPVYDTRVLFLRWTDSTRDLMLLWHEEMEAGGDERLAFQRALYQVKPLILPLPTTWIHGK